MPQPTLHVVVVFGLDDGQYNLPALLRLIWNRPGVRLHPVCVGWKDGGDYSPKQDMVLKLVDELLATGDLVGLIGISAGASLVVNVYALRPQLVGIVNICGALRLLRTLTPRLARSVNSSAAFRESLLVCEQSQLGLTPTQLNRTLIMEPFRDFVPIATMKLEGARTQRLWGWNHTLSILTAMIFYRRKMLRFLRSQSPNG